MGATHGIACRRKADPRRGTAMSGLLRLPGSRPRAIFLEIGEHDPRFIVPLVFGEMEGLQWRRIRPGGDLQQPPLPIPWIVLIDDRHPGPAGPSSFDAGTLRWLFSDAFQIAVDAAEPHAGISEHMVGEGRKR